MHTEYTYEQAVVSFAVVQKSFKELDEIAIKAVANTGEGAKLQKSLNHSVIAKDQ